MADQSAERSGGTREEALEAQCGAKVPLGRLGTPDEVAAVVAFCARSARATWRARHGPPTAERCRASSDHPPDVVAQASLRRSGSPGHGRAGRRGRSRPSGARPRPRARRDGRAAAPQASDSSVARAPRSCSEASARAVGVEEALVVDQVAEQLPVGDEGVGVLALAPGGRGQAVREPVDHLDRLALLVHALGVAGPARHDRGRARDLAAVRELVRGSPAAATWGCGRSSRRTAGRSCRATSRVGEALDQGVLVLVEVHPGHRGAGSGSPPRPCTPSRNAPEQRVLRGLVHEPVPARYPK